MVESNSRLAETRIKHPYTYWRTLYKESALGIMSTDISTKVTNGNYNNGILIKDLSLDQLKEQARVNQVVHKLIEYDKRKRDVEADFVN